MSYLFEALDAGLTCSVEVVFDGTEFLFVVTKTFNEKEIVSKGGN